jgi:hypothetical protein
MTVFKTNALALCFALSAGTALAQDGTAKTTAPADSAKPTVTAQECRDMAASKKEGVAKDEAKLKKEAACADVLRKDDSAKAGATSTEPAKK